MKTKIILLTLLLNTYMFIDLLAQTMPLVYDVENTGADYPKPPIPSFNQLPTIQALPDPFEWADGRGRISNFSDWRYRRAEIRAQIQNYEIGKSRLFILHHKLLPATLVATYSECYCERPNTHADFTSHPAGGGRTLPCSDRYE